MSCPTGFSLVQYTGYTQCENTFGETPAGALQARAVAVEICKRDISEFAFVAAGLLLLDGWWRLIPVAAAVFTIGHTMGGNPIPCKHLLKRL